MKVNSGSLKGKILNSPQTSAVRPTSDKVKAAVFSSLMDYIPQATFLDMFAGSGAVGIEAYSRGAIHITFVEQEPQTLKNNVKLLEPASFTIIAKDIFKVKFTKQYDIIFVDPPYGIYPVSQILDFIHKNNILAENGIIAYEESMRTVFDAANMPLSCGKQRKYGDTCVTYWLNRPKKTLL